MAYKLTIDGNTMEELVANIQKAAAFYADPKSEINIELDAKKVAKEVAKVSQTTQKEPEVSTDSTSVFDGVKYGLKNTSRNIWILLNDGRVLFVPAGGRLPLDSERAKNITKGEYTTIAEEEPERVVKSISEVIDEQAKTVSKKDEPEEVDEDVEDVEDEPEDDEEDEDDEDDEDEDDDEEFDEAMFKKLKKATRELKKIKGGKKQLKEILEDYDIESITDIEDNDMLEEILEEVQDVLDGE